MTHPSSADRPTPPPADEWDEFLDQLDRFRRSQFDTAPAPSAADPAAPPAGHDVDAFAAGLDRYIADLEDDAPESASAASAATSATQDDDFAFDDDDAGASEPEALSAEAGAAAEATAFAHAGLRPPLGLVVPAADDDDDEPHTLFVDPDLAPMPVGLSDEAAADPKAAPERARMAWPFALLLGLFVLLVPAGVVLACVFAPRFVPAPTLLAALHAPLPWGLRLPLWTVLAVAAVLLVAVLFVAGPGRTPRRRFGAFFTWFLAFPFWLVVASAAALIAPLGWSAAWTAQTGSPHAGLAAWLVPTNWPASVLCQRPALLRLGEHATPLCSDGFGPLADPASGPRAVTLSGAASAAGLWVHSLTPLCRSTDCPKQPAVLRKSAHPASPAPAEPHDGPRPL